MYRQFCENLKNYHQLNNSTDYRSIIGEELLIFIDKNKFNTMKQNRDSEMNSINRLLNLIDKENDRKCNKFLWELYAYGFDISLEAIKENKHIVNNEKENDKIELLKLLLGTTYWN
ncbi:MAG: hypothetical protein U9N10_07225 [Bacillota bacterium]|nr:hypothetical protein [Bacillota bacterium]